MYSLLIFLAPDSILSDAKGTSEFLYFMDQVFDSINGSSVRPQNGKMLRCAVSNSSPHIEFWNEAITVFKSMKFTTYDGKSTTPPCVKNWIITLQSFRYIWSQLNTSFKFLSLRNINQDPLECTFGAIRSHGVRNVNPTRQQLYNLLVPLKHY